MKALAKALQRNATLEILHFSGNAIGDVGAQELAKGLESNAALQRVDLSSNSIGDAGAQALAKVLEKNATLLRFDLSYNQIGDVGLQALAKALETNRTLQMLPLLRNPSNFTGLQALITALQSNVTLLYYSGADRSGSIQSLTERNRFLEKICTSQTLLERTREVAMAMRSIDMPIYVLLEIVEWELALRMVDIELECVGKHFIPIDCHQRRCESLDRQKRVQIIESICKQTYIYSYKRKK